CFFFCFFFQAEDGIRDGHVTGVQTCALPISLLFISARGLVDDVYVQIGLVMLIGLSAKNSILIVEFAEQLIEQGRSITNAAMERSEERRVGKECRYRGEAGE